MTEKGRNPGQMKGRSPYMQGVFFEGAESLAGQIVELKIVGATLNSLEGELERVPEVVA